MPSNRNLLLSFSSIYVDSDITGVREIEYQICYEQLMRVLPDNFDIIFIDNTMDSIESAPTSLRANNLKQILSSNETLLYDGNVGKSNKGIGELDMLIKVFEEYDLGEYDKICYLSGRKIITCPYVFEKTNRLSMEALISNPPIYELSSGHQHPVNSNLYNDMFFSMNRETMVGYVNHTINNLDNMIANNIGSEQNLFQYINENKISYEWLEHLGFIRNDWAKINPDFYSRNNENFQWI